MDSVKDFRNRAIGRPAIIAFMILVGTYLTNDQLIPCIFLKENKNQSRNIDPQKIRTENLNGRFALVGTYINNW